MVLQFCCISTICIYDSEYHTWLTGVKFQQNDWRKKSILYLCFKYLSLFKTVKYPSNSCWYFTLFDGIIAGLFWFHSVRPCVRPSVCPPSALYRLQFWLDLCHIYVSYQATSEGVSPVKFFTTCQHLNFWQVFKFVILICLVLTWDLMWNTSMSNHGAAGCISERRRSTCSSLFW